MPKLKVCKKCPHNDSTYGCMKIDCQIWVDTEAEWKYEIEKEGEEEENEDGENRK